MSTEAPQSGHKASRRFFIRTTLGSVGAAIILPLGLRALGVIPETAEATDLPLRSVSEMLEHLKVAPQTEVRIDRRLPIESGGPRRGGRFDYGIENITLDPIAMPNGSILAIARLKLESVDGTAATDQKFKGGLVIGDGGNLVSDRDLLNSTIYLSGGTNRFEVLHTTNDTFGNVTNNTGETKVGEIPFPQQVSVLLGWMLNEEGTQVNGVLPNGSLTPTLNYNRSMYSNGRRELQFQLYNSKEASVLLSEFRVFSVASQR